MNTNWSTEKVINGNMFNSFDQNDTVFFFFVEHDFYVFFQLLLSNWCDGNHFHQHYCMSLWLMENIGWPPSVLQLLQSRDDLIYKQSIYGFFFLSHYIYHCVTQYLWARFGWSYERVCQCDGVQLGSLTRIAILYRIHLHNLFFLPILNLKINT